MEPSGGGDPLGSGPAPEPPSPACSGSRPPPLSAHPGKSQLWEGPHPHWSICPRRQDPWAACFSPGEERVRRALTLSAQPCLRCPQAQAPWPGEGAQPCRGQRPRPRTHRPEGATHQELGHRQRLALLAQGHIGEEGTGGPVALLGVVHHGVSVHQDLDLHGLVAREGHAAGDGDDTACGAQTARQGGWAREARKAAGPRTPSDTWLDSTGHSAPCQDVKTPRHWGPRVSTFLVGGCFLHLWRHLEPNSGRTVAVTRSHPPSQAPLSPPWGCLLGSGLWSLGGSPRPAVRSPGWLETTCTSRLRPYLWLPIISL